MSWGSCKLGLDVVDMTSHWRFPSFLIGLHPRVRNTKLIGGPCLFSRGLWLRWRVVAIAHRSVILECFGCFGLVLTMIIHRFGVRMLWFYPRGSSVIVTSANLDLSSSIWWCGGFLASIRLSWRTGTASTFTRSSRLNVIKARAFDYVTCNGVVTYNRNTAQADSVAWPILVAMLELSPELAQCQS